MTDQIRAEPGGVAVGDMVSWNSPAAARVENPL